jgi:hypothetical protein
VARYTPEQRRNIAEAIRLTRRDRPKTRKSLLEAMAVEANFRHIPYGHSSSQGVLQQRPDMGWGPYIPGVKGVRQDIGDYLSRARRLMREGFAGTPGQLAQAVQRSAFPERYDQRAGEVNSILRRHLSFQGGSSGTTMKANDEVHYKPVQSPRKAASNFMLDQLRVAGGDPQALNSAPMLSAMMASSEGPVTEYEPTPGHVTETTAPVGRGATAPKFRGGGGIGGGIEELFYDPLGAIDNNTNIKAIGGHGSHVHFSARNVGQIKGAIARAKRLGLRVSENPAVDPVDPVHTKGSFHYQKFPGTKYGRAIDVSGNSKRMAAFYRWVERQYRR